jgi:hypothetical protein
MKRAFRRVDVSRWMAAIAYTAMSAHVLLLCSVEAHSCDSVHLAAAPRVEQTRIVEDDCRHFEPAGIMYRYKQHATLCNVAVNTAYILPDIEDTVCRVRQLPDVPTSVYDSVVLKVRMQFPRSGIKGILSTEIRPEHDLGCDITSPWVVPRVKQLIFENDTTLLALMRVSIAAYVSNADRTSWFPYVTLVRFDYPSLSLRSVHPVEVDSARPYAQDITLLIDDDGAILCSSFDVLRFDDPRPEHAVIGEWFSPIGTRTARPAMCLPTEIARHQRYKGWLHGFVRDSSHVYVANEYTGSMVAWPIEHVAGSAAQYAVAFIGPPYDIPRKGAHFVALPIEGARGTLVLLEHTPTDTANTLYRVATHMVTYDGKVSTRGILVRHEARRIDLNELPFFSAVRADGRTHVVEHRFAMRHAEWFIDRRVIGAIP